MQIMMDASQLSIELLHQSLGARVQDGNKTEFTVWAPAANEVAVDVVGKPAPVTMKQVAGGFHHVVVDGAGAGDRYWLRVDGGPPRPDPASRFQPEGVHGPSEVIDARFPWTDTDWQGHPREDLIIYELHIGTFTAGGTFLSAIDRLGELVELGVTAIELMPVAACAGRWNWGYDGVGFFAPADAYGTPSEFRRLVDAAHAIGLSVFLDVVYNHVGPEGNYLNEFGPYFSDRHHTVWGEAPNFDDPVHGDAVRRFFIANAIHWIDEYHLDGLRVDAIHCMKDDRDPHVAAEMADAFARWSKLSPRNPPRDPLLIAESNVFDPEMTQPTDRDGIGFDAMWCDDFLHSTFAVLRPGEQLSNRSYRAGHDLDQVLRSGYVYEGTLRKQRGRTIPDRRPDSRTMIYSIQNHDFIGNHPLGMRLHQLTDDHAHRAAAALLMLSPAIPMLFMGEEFASPNPFQFFVDFSDEALRKAVVEGRRREYPQHDWESGRLPTDPSVFESSNVGRRTEGNLETWEFYRSLIRLRKTWQAIGLLQSEHLSVVTDLPRGVFRLIYRSGEHAAELAVRLGRADSSDTVSLDASGDVILDSHAIRSARTQATTIMLQANHAIVMQPSADLS